MFLAVSAVQGYSFWLLPLRLFWPWAVTPKKMRTLFLKRIAQSEKGTFGVLIEDDEPFALTLEPPWKDNETFISCIPEGRYSCVETLSPAFGETFEITNVPERSKILFHKGNVGKNTKGCVLVGEQFQKVYGEPGIAASYEGFKEFSKRFRGSEEFELEIRGTGEIEMPKKSAKDSIKEGVKTSEFGMAILVIVFNILNQIFGWNMSDAALMGVDGAGMTYIGGRAYTKKGAIL